MNPKYYAKFRNHWGTIETLQVENFNESMVSKKLWILAGSSGGYLHPQEPDEKEELLEKYYYRVTEVVKEEYFIKTAKIWSE